MAAFRMDGSVLTLAVEQVSKQFRLGDVIVNALHEVSFTVRRGEAVALLGASGSGKSTLLGLIGGLDTPTSGRVSIDGVDITRLGERRLTRIRNEKLGFIFQAYHLIPTLTALENVALPAQFAARRRQPPLKRAKALLTLLGLGERLHHRPAQLSGGQQQRVAIARALANEPPILLADEPTGNLDSESGALVLDTLLSVQAETGTTLLVVTHDESVASRMARRIVLADGRVVVDAPALTGAGVLS